MDTPDAAGTMHEYRIRFRALSPRPLAGDAAHRLADALIAMPGAGAVEGAEQDPGEPRVSAGFVIPVRLGMADAARDGSRLAKEALKVAGLGDALLLELAVTLLAGGSSGPEAG